MKEGVFAVVRTLADLGELVTLAPERHRAAGLAAIDGEPLGSLAEERRERVTDEDLGDAIVFDTTHVKEGLVDVAAAARGTAPSSAKKRVRSGDLLVSRLRPYLRQIGLVTDDVRLACEGRPMACSTEFYVLSPPKGGSLAYLLPWLLGDATQAVLAAAQEGGHHPRVPRETLLALRVPSAVVKKRVATSRAVEGALVEVYAAQKKLRRALG
jgi:hypothetical protein